MPCGDLARLAVTRAEDVQVSQASTLDSQGVVKVIHKKIVEVVINKERERHKAAQKERRHVVVKRFNVAKKDSHARSRHGCKRRAKSGILKCIKVVGDRRKVGIHL